MSGLVQPVQPSPEDAAAEREEMLADLFAKLDAADEREHGAERKDSEGEEEQHTPKLAAPETWRPATSADPPCSCGLPALVVFLTDNFGPVSSCRR